MVRKTRSPLVDPNALFALVKGRIGCGRGSETAYVGDIKEYAVAFGDSLYLAAMLSLKTKVYKPSILRYPEILLVIYHHPEVTGHINLETPAIEPGINDLAPQFIISR